MRWYKGWWITEDNERYYIIAHKCKKRKAVRDGNGEMIIRKTNPQRGFCTNCGKDIHPAVWEELKLVHALV